MYEKIWLVSGSIRATKELEKIYVTGEDIAEAIENAKPHFDKNDGFIFDAEMKTPPLYYSDKQPMRR